MRDSPLSWQKILAQGFSTVDELLEFLSLPLSLGSKLAEQTFKTRVPRGFAARMQKGNARDPLLLQILATQAELQNPEGYHNDPLAEHEGNPRQGLLHKYQGRVLLTLTGVCAVNCRYCFRRHFPYRENNPGRGGWQDVLEYIKSDRSIKEVILSGGDPLLASNAVLREFFNYIHEITHLRTVRFHTRVPVVLPERIDSELLSLLKNSPCRKIMVMHINHAQELDHSVQTICESLKQSGCHLLNQSVLLKDINDDANVLAELSEKLLDFGILPYYLHLLDKVKGAAHFDLPIEKALSIYRELQEKVPGYLLPRLAREEAGKKSKTLLL
ncbi:EF-P beta-lysylation protein EpmB [Legionella jordanis]|uniref:L-lysine 2,3-aminomutase n=2 Tax=Legionella jordanis TaxID=456 RepID=A0A0W0VC20_9GAMM|nr:EF-P beta-lysylation protein EpmB [Legionella jordanis]KTD17664.1 lysine 2,3-aminomutase [Legionella jordanis]RMX01536.1 EF-P beta-lysylation protein EpmB [Legionella jordanis]RMX21531.1 EF-P beta-lysylation protein EpmB [Legionella jordanis]VEH11407.1 lysine 2,3-aminomutase [Legionella jordanis]